MQERTECFTEHNELVERLLQPQPVVIGIEGGPCGGKTTLVENVLAKAGRRKVVVLPEAASHHINELAQQGIEFTELIDNDRASFLEVEARIMRSIVQNIEAAREVYAGTDAIIIADRCDLQAYVTETEHAEILDKLGMSYPPFLEQIDQLYYLPSVARLDAKLYENLKRSNPARYESATDAILTCERNLAAVARHPELHMRWGGEFHDTIDRLTDSILHPETESEVKLQPVLDNTMTAIVKMGGERVSESEILQSYHRLGDVTFRLRVTLTERHETLYSFTCKQGNGTQRHEVQRRINERQYRLLCQVPRVGAPLAKQRTMVLLPAAKTSQKRLWAFDRYHDRRLPEWSLETDIDSEDGIEPITNELWGYEPHSYTAESLSRQLAKRALLPKW